jgi:hypothetical protein
LGIAIAVIPFQEFERFLDLSQSNPAGSNRQEFPSDSLRPKVESEPLLSDRFVNERRLAGTGAGIGGSVVRKTRTLMIDPPRWKT